MLSRVVLGERRLLFVGLMIGLLAGATLVLFADVYHDNNIFVPGANTVLELSAKGVASDVRSWKAGKIGVEGASLFINNIGEPGTVDTIINNLRGNVGIGTTVPLSKLAVRGLPASPPDTSGTAGLLCITNDGNIWIDTTPATPCS